MGGRRSQYYDLYENDEEDDSEYFSRPVTPDRLNSLIPEQIEDLGRKVTATAEHFFGNSTVTSDAYKSAIKDIHKKLKEPRVQRSVYQIARRSQHSLASTFAISNYLPGSSSTLPDHLLHDIPERDPDAPEQSYSLYQGFQVSVPSEEREWAEKNSRLLMDGRDKRTGRLLTDGNADTPKRRLQMQESGLKLKLEAMRIRKKMASCEIMEIDQKIQNLKQLRVQVVDRLADLEQSEIELEGKLIDIQTELDEVEEEEEDEEDGDEDRNRDGESTGRAGTEDSKAEESDLEVIDMPGDLKKPHRSGAHHRLSKNANAAETASSIPSHKKRRRSMKRMSVPILHEHLEPGSSIRVIKTGHDGFTAIDFDRPFGLMVTAGLDDSVFVWDLSLGRRIGSLEGHLSSVKCLQIDDTIVATGSTDATIKLWDLSQADHARGRIGVESGGGLDDDDVLFASPIEDDDGAYVLGRNSLEGCEIVTLESHVMEVTALHVHGSTLVSGSEDKTLRQWDLVKGRCVQTLDIIWAAAQSSGSSDQWGYSGGGNMMSRSAMMGGAGGFSSFGSAGVGGFSSGFGGVGASGVGASFVGALQFSNYDLASGTADGVVRMWDLRSGHMTRNMIGHTGPITGLQFDDYHMVTSSLDKSVRIWDIRTGTIFEAFGYDHPITSMMFDNRKVVAAAGEKVVKVYDKVEGLHYDIGVGVAPRGGAVLAPTSSNTHNPARGVSGGLAIEGNDDVSVEGSLKGERGSRPKSRRGGAGASGGLLPGMEPSITQHVRIRDSYLVEGREDGVVGIWSC